MRIVLVRPAEPRIGFSERLEARAQRILERSAETSPSPALWVIRNEIALTLDHLHRVRELHDGLRRETAAIISYIESDFRARTPPPLVYLDVWAQVRQRQRERVLRLQSEQRHLTLSESEQLRTLHDRLLSLVARERQVAGLHEHRSRCA